MGFNSLQFLFLFLPLFLVVYYLCPPAHRNLVLVLGGLVFYAIGAWGRLWNLLLLLQMMMITYLAGIGMTRGDTQRRSILVGSLILLFGTLLCFKYVGVAVRGWALPLGISFYLFQMAAYLIAAYRRQITPENRLLPFSAGVLLFPKLLSGPLMEPADLQSQVQTRRYDWRNFDAGLREFIWGLALKVLVADRVGGLWRQAGVIGYESLSTPMAWLSLVAYSLQLYFDFCGYSKMAVGLGMMLGFRLPQNFAHPYAARSMGEFWRRWHITLGAWFRNYVYIPLGGNRKGMARTLLNLLVVWLLTAMWHGNSWNFILWGLFIFFLLANERLWLGKRLDRHPVLAHGYMVLAIPLSWLLFAVEDVQSIGTYLGRLFFTGGGVAVNPQDFVVYGRSYWLMILVGIVLAMPWPERLWEKIRSTTVGTVLCFLLFWAAVYCICVAENDPFMYFQF